MASKYHAKKTVIDGITFDSKKEAKRYLELKYMEENNIIQNLVLQPEWTLVMSQLTSQGRLRPVKYRADFTYYRNGKLIVEDVKGVKTPEYIIKKKLMFEKYRIEITEI